MMTTRDDEKAPASSTPMTNLNFPRAESSAALDNEHTLTMPELLFNDMTREILRAVIQKIAVKIAGRDDRIQKCVILYREEL